ncbi:conserved hypothetical protein [uncultured Desulfatiglans sp.]|nr:conserved hypothetical protein [uncultured Desulfatiglans sp.]
MKTLTIIVCLKTVSDPEGPVSAFEVQPEEKRVLAKGIPPVINPYDENALELALRLKDRWGGRIVAINASGKAAAAVLKKALAVGVDDLILVEDPAFDDLTSEAAARVLCAAVEKVGEYDLILTGRQSADWDSAQTGLLLAEMLAIPAINLVKGAEILEGRVEAEKLRRIGFETVRASLPALLTVSSEAGELRMPSIKAVLEARKKPLTKWTVQDLVLDVSALRTRNIVSLSAPPSTARQCAFIEGGSGEEKGENLALRLRQDGLI